MKQGQSQFRQRRRVTLWALGFATASFVGSAALAQLCERSLLSNQVRAQGEAPAMKKFKAVFGTAKPVIGMIHLAGSSDAKVIERALEELSLFERTGVHAAIIENYHGSLKQVVKVLAAAQNRFPKLVLGINVLPNDYRLAFYLARTFGAKFIQLDYVSGRYQYDDSGEFAPIELNSRDYHKYRRAFPEILVLGGVHPKYYEPIEGSKLSRDIATAKLRADAVVVTGSGTGQETPLQKIQEFRQLVGPDFPLVIGAGVNAENGPQQFAIGNGAIVGSYFKDGDTRGRMIEDRVLEILQIAIQNGKGN